MQDGEKLTDALTFRLAVETGAADVLAEPVRRGAGAAGRAGETAGQAG